jgi:excisionase family DNA binding protein
VSPIERPEQDEPLLTAVEVASVLQATPDWFDAASRRDGLPHVRLGRYVRFRRSAIEQWLDEVQRGPHAH